MHSTNALISIITPTYNSIQFIEETIRSIIKQTYQNWELLITDDCSTDGTWTLLKEYVKRDGRIKIFRLDVNSGAGVARNNSIKHAKGQYIAFCDSDDQWKPNKLEVQLSFMEKNNCALSYSSYSIVSEKGTEIGDVIAKSEINHRVMLRNNYIGCLTAMYDTQKLGKVYMPEIRKRQDWALWLLILKKTDKACGIKESLALYRDRSDSISSNKMDLLKYNWIIYREVEGLSIPKSSICMIQFFYYYIMKKIE